MDKTSIKIGWSTQDSTPAGPTMLAGQMGNRLALEAIDPLSCTAMAIESGNGENVIMLSADIVTFCDVILDATKNKIAEIDSSVNLNNIFGSATHTHTAPQYGEIIPMERRFEPSSRTTRGNCGIDAGQMKKKYPDFVDSEEYFEFFTDKLALAAIEAWNNRKKSYVAWGMGTAAIGECRRLCYDGEETCMYGRSDTDNFYNVEGHVDHNVNMLFVYDENKKLSGMVLNIACPSQATEALHSVSADFWHEIRQQVHREFGEHIYLLPQCSAAGDQSPHILLDKKSHLRMLTLKGFIDDKSSLQFGDRKEIADRMIKTIKDVYPYACKDIREHVEFKYQNITLDLPVRIVKIEEVETANAQAAELLEKLRIKEKENAEQLYDGRINWLTSVQHRFDQQKENDTITTKCHFIRLGDIAFASNRFELYLDYGDRIKNRSKAVQTFLVQLAGDGTYLPSRRSSGGYGSVASSNLVGYEGGDMLVDEQVKIINSMFGDE